jgi:hypothetical protein
MALGVPVADAAQTDDTDFKGHLVNPPVGGDEGWDPE